MNTEKAGLTQIKYGESVKSFFGCANLCAIKEWPTDEHRKGKIRTDQIE